MLKLGDQTPLQKDASGCNSFQNKLRAILADRTLHQGLRYNDTGIAGCFNSRTATCRLKLPSTCCSFIASMQHSLENDINVKIELIVSGKSSTIFHRKSPVFFSRFRWPNQIVLTLSYQAHQVERGLERLEALIYHSEELFIATARTSIKDSH